MEKKVWDAGSLSQNGQIDKLVYELCNLTDEEIAIVEKTT